MQYVVAVALLKNAVPEAPDFQNESPFTSNPAVDTIRRKIAIRADEDLTRDYLNWDKKSIPSAVTIHLSNGDTLDEVLVEFPVGHVESAQTAAQVRAKFERNMGLMFSGAEIAEIERTVREGGETSISDFVDLLVREHKVPSTKL